MNLYVFRTLGSIACIIPERKNVHHIIIHALDSHDDVEVEAAIFAAEKFSEKSKYVLHSSDGTCVDFFIRNAFDIRMV